MAIFAGLLDVFCDGLAEFANGLAVFAGKPGVFAGGLAYFAGGSIAHFASYGFLEVASLRRDISGLWCLQNKMNGQPS